MSESLALERVVGAQAQYKCCVLCEHRCEIDRHAGQRGPCKAGTIPNVFRHRVEYGDELELVPSHLFYLSGCDLRCVFCIAGINAFDPTRGEPLTNEYFNEAIAWGRARGARNVQWVGGEPTIHLPRLLEVMAQCPDLPPVVWKSDFHGTPEAFSLLKGVIDTYVADYKFGNDQCAQRLAGVPNYLAIVQRNLGIARKQGKLIIRHLLMPGHFECCYRPMVAWLKANMPDIPISLWEGFQPRWRAKQFEELSETLPAGEGERARELARIARLQVLQ